MVEHFLPHGVAVLLIKSMGAYLSVCSSHLTEEERLAAKIIAHTRALGGQAAVIVKFSDVAAILEKVA